MSAKFRHIALSLSGGGTRAIGFHIGTLDILDRCGLLQQVKTLSTVSGGSLVGTSYALSISEGMSYRELFCIFFEFLPRANIVQGLADVLTRKKRPVPGGSRDMATGLAEIYHQQFFSQYFTDPYFGALQTGGPDQPRHLEDFSFNATDFRSAIAFRFQKSVIDCKVGNFNSWLEPDQSNEIRIADIVTASSCIPAMFEPMRMPVDFHWPEQYTRGDRKGEPFGPVKLHFREGLEPSENLALMDGGVYDNQGLTTVLLAISRRQEQEDEAREASTAHNWARWSRELLNRFSMVDLFIISDTPLRKPSFLEAYREPGRVKGFAGWLRSRTLGQVNRFATAIALILLASSVWALLRIFDYGELTHFRRVLEGGWFGWIHIVLEVVSLLIPLGVSAIIGASILAVKNRIADVFERASSQMPPLQRKPWFYLRKLRIGSLLDMGSARRSSVMAMVSDIFAHRIRQLGYGLAYGNDQVAPTLLANEIYELEHQAQDQLTDDCVPVSELTSALCHLAAHMQTKSWFDTLNADELVKDSDGRLSPEQARELTRRKDGTPRTDLDLLVACGQLTTCFNLIKRLDDETSPAVRSPEIVAALVSSWNQLQQDPFCIIDENLQNDPRASG